MDTRQYQPKIGRLFCIFNCCNGALTLVFVLPNMFKALLVSAVLLAGSCASARQMTPAQMRARQAMAAEARRTTLLDGAGKPIGLAASHVESRAKGPQNITFTNPKASGTCPTEPSCSVGWVFMVFHKNSTSTERLSPKSPLTWDQAGQVFFQLAIKATRHERSERFAVNVIYPHASHSYSSGSFPLARREVLMTLSFGASQNSHFETPCSKPGRGLEGQTVAPDGQ